MPSPDATPYVDLTLYDKDAQQVFEDALIQLQSHLPEWSPREGNTEVLLLEALGYEVGDLIFAVNRLPGTIIEVLLRLYGIDRDLGSPPVASVRFYPSDLAGHDLPAGVRVSLTAGNGETVQLATTTSAAIPPNTTSVVVPVVGDRNTDAANGTAAGTPLAMLDAIAFLERAELAIQVGGGAGEEDDSEWFTRGIRRFSRLVETLVLPSHFTEAALERPGVVRAQAIDNFNPHAVIAPPHIDAVTTATTGGTLAAGTYTYRITARNAQGETTAGSPAAVVTTGTTSTARPSWTAPTVPPYTDPIIDYRVYGRHGGNERLLATVPAGTTAWTDTGAESPGALPPANNLTGSPPGTHLGYVAVAVYGDRAQVPFADKEALRVDLDAKAQVNLAVNVVDPTITPVAVTATVRALPGYTEAQVRANVTAVLDAYLDPSTWPWRGSVFRNELIARMDTAEGVDRVVSLAAPAADVTLVGVAPLADLGTVNISVDLP